jgi:hypothetical protein
MRREIPLAIGFVLLVASIAFAQEATATAAPSPPKPAMSKAQSQKIIIATEKKLWEAWKKNDSKPFKDYLAADSLMVGDTGVANKATSIKEMSSMKCEVKSYELTEMKVTFFDSDAAFLTYKSVQDATCGGEAVPPSVWSSSVYVRRGGKWYAASHQETPAK